ncbi:MAG: hypothetical protein ACREAA_15320 [Candidatus Polarisedimenticolia bacterium]
MPAPTPDYLALLRALKAHDVDFIVVGGVCAVLHGAPVATFDLDVVHSRSPENIGRLLKVLAALKAKIVPGRSHLASSGHQLLMTAHGPLDLLGTVGTGRGYDELLPHSTDLELTEDLTINLLDLETLIALKEETGHEKDLAVLPVLRRTLEERNKR